MRNDTFVALIRRGVLIAIIVVVALVGLGACTPSTRVVEVTRVTSDAVALGSVNITESQTVTNQISQVKTFDQCASASPLMANIQFGSSSGQSSQRELVLSAGAGGQVGLSSVIFAQLEGAIKQHFASSVVGESSHMEVVQIEVPARSRQEYSIVWQESRREGTVQYEENGEAKTASYSYRIGLELNSSTVRDLPCPTGGAIPTPSVSEPVGEAPTPNTPINEGGNTAAPTAIPASSLPLPFEDGFDSGLQPAWQVISGQPVVANGRLKPAGYDMLTVQVGDNSLGNNFSVSMDLDRCHTIYNDVTITLAEEIRFRFDQTRYYWEAFQNNEWIILQDGDVPLCEARMQLRIAGTDYSILSNGQLFSTGTYGQPTSGPVMISLEYAVTIDNFRITSP